MTLLCNSQHTLYTNTSMVFVTTAVVRVNRQLAGSHLNQPQTTSDDITLHVIECVVCQPRWHHQRLSTVVTQSVCVTEQFVGDNGQVHRHGKIQSTVQRGIKGRQVEGCSVQANSKCFQEVLLSQLIRPLSKYLTEKCAENGWQLGMVLTG